MFARVRVHLFFVVIDAFELVAIHSPRMEIVSFALVLIAPKEVCSSVCSVKPSIHNQAAMSMNRAALARQQREARQSISPPEWPETRQVLQR